MNDDSGGDGVLRASASSGRIAVFPRRHRSGPPNTLTGRAHHRHTDAAKLARKELLPDDVIPNLGQHPIVELSMTSERQLNAYAYVQTTDG